MNFDHVSGTMLHVYPHLTLTALWGGYLYCIICTAEMRTELAKVREHTKFLFLAASFITALKWEHPRCLSTDEWINKPWNIYTMEYYLTIKWVKVLIIRYHVDGTWRNLMLSERSHSQRPHIVWLHSQETSRIGKSIQTERRFVVVGRGAGEDEEELLNECGVPLE